jgi:tRNA pseudouridine55 synthase
VSWDGLLIVDKPSGPTSHDVVQRVRRITGQRRIGHSGTLDPLASGVLPLVLGRATRLVRFLPHSPKHYCGALRLGLATDSDDRTGAIVSRYEGALPSVEEVRRLAGELIGAYRQTPPAVSARKVDGRRMYRLAREGVTVAAEPRPVQVDRFDLEPIAGSDGDYAFETTVSVGTYVRALARDLGDKLGCGGTLLELRRTAIGSIREAASLSLEPDPPSIDQVRTALVPLDTMPLTPPPLRLPHPDDVPRFRSGVVLAVPAGDLPDGYCRVLDGDGRLIGIGEVAGERLRPRVVLLDGGA